MNTWEMRCKEIATMGEEQIRAEFARIAKERAAANRTFMENKRRVHEHYTACSDCKGKTEAQVIQHSGVKF